MKERYTIVSCRQRCPKIIDTNWLCNNKSCSICTETFGDTKEHIVRKIETALVRELRNDEVTTTFRDIATKIAEYLGVLK